jgi:hypothetical protein
LADTNSAVSNQWENMWLIFIARYFNLPSNWMANPMPIWLILPVDAEQDEWLNQQGIAVFRYENRWVFEYPEVSDKKGYSGVWW